MTDPTPVEPTPEAAAPQPAPAAPPAAAPDPAPAAPSTTWTPPASVSAAVGSRPTGITILAILAGIGGVFGLLGGFVIMGAGALVFGGVGAIFGLAVLALAGLSLAFAYGAWTLKPWAWPLGVVLAGASIIVAVLEIILGGSGYLFNGVITAILYGVVLYYLNQPGIKTLFGRA